jgi:hypothetical protein
MSLPGTHKLRLLEFSRNHNISRNDALGGTVYLVFLPLMMMALSAKVAAMGILGYNVIPVVYIIPPMALGSLGITWRLVRSFSKPQGTPEVS